MWVGISKKTVSWPFMFFENTVTGGTYLDMLEQFLEPQLQQDCILGAVVYQQDGAPPHFALPVREYLNRTFPNRWIERRSPCSWAACSPDLTWMEFFWGFVKDKVYRTKVCNLAVLKQRLREACAMITVAMLQKVGPIEGYRDPLGIMFWNGRWARGKRVNLVYVVTYFML